MRIFETISMGCHHPKYDWVHHKQNSNANLTSPATMPNDVLSCLQHFETPEMFQNFNF